MANTMHHDAAESGDPRAESDALVEQEFGSADVDPDATAAIDPDAAAEILRTADELANASRQATFLPLGVREMMAARNRRNA